VQKYCFDDAVQLLKKHSPDAFDSFLKRLNDSPADIAEMHRVLELKSLRSLRPWVDKELMLRVDGRLENAELPVDSKHSLNLPGRHALTRLMILNEHSLAGHAGPSYILMKTRQRFWIIHGIANVKRYISKCSKCARRKTTSIRQLMTDLPSCRFFLFNKPLNFVSWTIWPVLVSSGSE